MLPQPENEPTCNVREVKLLAFFVAILALMIAPIVALVNFTDVPDVRVWAPALAVALLGVALWRWSYVPVHLELGPDRLRIRPQRAGRAGREILFSQIARCLPPEASPVQAMLLQTYDGHRTRFSRLVHAEPPFVSIDDWTYKLVVAVEQARAADPEAQAAGETQSQARPRRSFGRSVVGTGLAVVVGLLIAMGTRVWTIPGRQGPPVWLFLLLLLFLAFYFRSRFASRRSRG